MVGVGGSVVQILYMQVKRFSLLLTDCQLSCEVQCSGIFVMLMMRLNFNGRL